MFTLYFHEQSTQRLNIIISGQRESEANQWLRSATSERRWTEGEPDARHATKLLPLRGFDCHSDDNMLYVSYSGQLSDGGVYQQSVV